MIGGYHVIYSIDEKKINIVELIKREVEYSRL
jgi:mRNA-degrading endonuclease RelE of RelBE toxin-antitoxin system